MKNILKKDSLFKRFKVTGTKMDSFFEPKVSIVIITKDRKRDLNKLLCSLKKMDYPEKKIEIIIIDGSEKPLKRLKGIKYYRAQKKGYGHARFLGVNNAHNEIVVFVDDDCVVTKEWLRELVNCFKSKDVGVGTGGVRLYKPNIIGRCEEVMGYPQGGLKRIKKANGKIIESRYASTCNCAYRKDVFDTVGNFNESLFYGYEDYEMANRARKKYKIVFNPKALVYHKPKNSLVKYFKWMVWRGYCDMYWARNMKDYDHIYFPQGFMLLAVMMFIINPYVLIFSYILFYILFMIRYFKKHDIRDFKVLSLTPLMWTIIMLAKVMGNYTYFLKGNYSRKLSV